MQARSEVRRSVGGSLSVLPLGHLFFVHAVSLDLQAAA